MMRRVIQKMLRAGRYNHLAACAEPRLVKVFDEGGAEIVRREVSPFADLQAELEALAAEWIEQGWERAGLGYGSVFLSKGPCRRMVAVVPHGGMTLEKWERRRQRRGTTSAELSEALRRRALL
jgi:hypothetical protein